MLIFGDFHLITEMVIYSALDYLLEHLPPQMHLIIATRHDPPLSLARLRARGQLVKFRVPDLHITKDEASQFLNEKQNQHRLNRVDAGTICLTHRRVGTHPLRRL